MLALGRVVRGESRGRGRYVGLARRKRRRRLVPHAQSESAAAKIVLLR